MHNQHHATTGRVPEQAAGDRRHVLPSRPAVRPFPAGGGVGRRRGGVGRCPGGLRSRRTWCAGDRGSGRGRLRELPLRAAAAVARQRHGGAGLSGGECPWWAVHVGRVRSPVAVPRMRPGVEWPLRFVWPVRQAARSVRAHRWLPPACRALLVGRWLSVSPASVSAPPPCLPPRRHGPLAATAGDSEVPQVWRAHPRRILTGKGRAGRAEGLVTAAQACRPAASPLRSPPRRRHPGSRRCGPCRPGGSAPCRRRWRCRECSPAS